jgi:hypothetical protein
VTSLDQGIIVLFLPVLVNSLMDIVASLFVQGPDRRPTASWAAQGRAEPRATASVNMRSATV